MVGESNHIQEGGKPAIKLKNECKTAGTGKNRYNWEYMERRRWIREVFIEGEGEKKKKKSHSYQGKDACSLSLI